MWYISYKYKEYLKTAITTVVTYQVIHRYIHSHTDIYIPKSGIQVIQYGFKFIESFGTAKWPHHNFHWQQNEET
jgi:hypothetical protein